METFKQHDESETELRNKAAKGIKNERLLEYLKYMVTNRPGSEYLTELRGLEHFFDNIRSLNAPVLDIGAGTTRGTRDLSSWSKAEGIGFRATVLKSDDKIQQYLGKERTIRSMAEQMSTIPNESFAGVLGLYSIDYSDSPQLAAQEIDRILVLGGAVKFNFFEDEHKPDLEDIFKNMGYDTYSVRDEEVSTMRIVLAVKAGGPSGHPTAKQIMMADNEEMANQSQQLDQEVKTLFSTEDHDRNPHDLDQT